MAMTPLRQGNASIPILAGNVAPGTVQPLATQAAPMAGAVAIGGIMERVQALGDQVNRRAARDTVAAATTAGAAAGEADPNAKPTSWDPLYNEAFTRAATDSAARRVEITARGRLDALAQEHAANPAAFAAAAQQYRDGMLAELPDTLKPQIAQTFDALALPYSNQIRQQQERSVAQQAIATFTEAMPGRIASLERLAGRATTDPAAASGLQQQEQQIIADLVRMGPREGFRFNGVDYPPDPTRSGAMTAPQLVRSWQEIEQKRNTAAVLGAYDARPAGVSPEQWINDFERSQGRNVTDRHATAFRYFTERGNFTPEQAAGIVANLHHESGMNHRVRPGDNGTAHGLAQWRLDRVEAFKAFTGGKLPGQASFEENLAFVLHEMRPGGPEEAAGRRLRQAKTAAEAAAIFSTLYERPKARDAEAAARAKTAEAMLPRLTGTALPADQAASISSTLRARQASDERALREQQERSWTELAPVVQANQAAVALTGKVQRELTDDQLRAAGRSEAQIREYRQAITFGQALFTANAQVATATPEDLDKLKARVMPGGDLFQANPAAAVQLANRLEEMKRGQAATGMDGRIRDLRAQAAASTADSPDVPPITPEEGARAGMTRAQVDAANADIQATQRAARLAGTAATGSPELLAATREALPVTGPAAAENARALQALEQALERRRSGVAKSPGDYVLGASAPIREAWNAALRDPAQTLPAIIATTTLQDRMGIPPALREAVPPSIAKSLVQNLAGLPTPAERMGQLAAMLQAMPDEAARKQTLKALADAGLPDGTRIGAALLPRLGPHLAGQIAGELAMDHTKLGHSPSATSSIRTTARDTFASTERGQLLRAQAEATGNPDFIARGATEQQTLERVLAVRTPAGESSASSSTASRAYEQLFGGARYVNRTGFLLTVPAALDADRVQRGLATVLDQALAGAPPASIARARRGSWVDAGAGAYAYVPANAGGVPLSVQGQPLMITAEQAADLAAVAPPRTEADRRDFLRRLNLLGAP